MRKHTYTQKQREEHANAQKEKIREISQRLEKGVKETFTSEKFTEFLKFCAKFPQYSARNQILIMMQKPDASLVQSYTAWKKVGRYVREGEHGIVIIAPSAKKAYHYKRNVHDLNGDIVRDENGDPVTEIKESFVQLYKCAYTFDISQTEGKPVPELGVNELSGTVANYDQLFKAICNIIPVPVVFEDIKTGAKGYFSPMENRIAIKNGLSEIHTIKTLIHEGAHQKLHNLETMKNAEKKPNRYERETQAESIAYIVCARFGLDTSEYSFPYVATYATDKEVPELSASLEIIRSTAYEMITQIEKELQNAQPEIAAQGAEVAA